MGLVTNKKGIDKVADIVLNLNRELGVLPWNKPIDTERKSYGTLPYIFPFLK
jgi:hypothetical protein